MSYLLQLTLFLLFYFHGSYASSYFIRVNSVSFRPTDIKYGVVLASSSIKSDTFFYAVINSTGEPIYEQYVQTDVTSSWSSSFRQTYTVTFSDITSPGRYTLRLYNGDGYQVAESQSFLIEDDVQIYRQLLNNSIFFFRAQRDGPDVDTSVMQRYVI
jgi:hypothetical protein